MTLLAHDAAMLGLPVDTARLYDGDDPHYELWLWAVVDRLKDTVRKMKDT